MKQQYTGPIKRITAYNAKKNNSYFEYETKEEILDEKAVFHYNVLGVLVLSNNKTPVIIEDELYDFFQDDFTKNVNSTYSYICVNPNELMPIKQKNKVLSKNLFKK